MVKIYVADDEQNIRQLIASVIEKENKDFFVQTFETGDQLLIAYMKDPADLVIIDVMMPGNDGFQIAKALREISETLPIILLTARDSDEDFITGFQTGIDEYLTKPFSPVHLALQVGAIFKKRGQLQEKRNLLTFKELQLTLSTRLLKCHEKSVQLTRNEMDILQSLMTAPHHTMSRNDLLNHVWGIENDEVETRVIDDTIKRLRKKVREVSSDVLIETIWGFGFKLSEKTTSVPQ